MEKIFEKYMGESLEKYIEEEGRYEYDYYYTFLTYTDYISNKLIDTQVLGIECDDYTEALKARQYARDQINKILGTE